MDTILTQQDLQESTFLPHEALNERSVKPLRIAVLSYRSTRHVGGQGIYVDYLTRALVDRGHKVDVLSGPPYPECDPRVRIIEIPSLDLYAKPHKGHYELRPHHFLKWSDTSEYFSHLTGKFSEPLTFGMRVRDYLSRTKDRYDVILDNQSLGNALLSRAVQKTPFVGVIHHPITRDLKLELAAQPDPKMQWLIRRWYGFHKEQIRTARQLPFIITPSEATRADIVTEFGLKPEQLHVIPLGVDQATFRPDRTIKRDPSLIVTTASSDVPLKGLRYLLEALSQVRKIRPDIRLVVIGTLRDGPTRKTLEDLDLSGSVEFRSGLSRQDLARTFSSASVSVTPSLYEGFGLPCAEAMSCGTPVITSDGGALPEVVGDAGTIVPRGNSEALAEALHNFFSLCENDRLRLSEKAFSRAQTHFNWSRIAPAYETVFERAIGSKC